ncbi:MAG: hypothetical protein ACFCUR_19250 [Rhodomicrobiaceae bacterium]
MDENTSVGDGQVVAVLVDRDDDRGGGTYGYEYDGDGDAWKPAQNSYPLPFDSLDLAAAAPQIDTARLDD